MQKENICEEREGEREGEREREREERERVKNKRNSCHVFHNF